MEPIVDLAAGADENPLAGEFARVLRVNLGVGRGAEELPADRARRLADFRALRGNVAVVAQDRGDSFTMRFDHGKVTLHEGLLGLPTITLCGDEAVLRRLFDVPISKRLRLPIPRFADAEERGVVSRLLSDLSGEGLTVYGLWSHPRTFVRLVRLLSCRRG